jgi:catechol 2,3-dioxygenase-like lactoylglutathione lyase family enzyme
MEHMTIQRMDHVGIVVDDLAAATEFFVELGLEPQGEGSVEGRWVDRVVGLEGVRADLAMMQTPDGNGRLELVKFHSPSNQRDNRHAPANAPGLHHVAFAVEDIDAVVACKPAALNSSASWSATRTSTGSATFAARRESSSS